MFWGRLSTPYGQKWTSLSITFGWIPSGGRATASIYIYANLPKYLVLPCTCANTIMYYFGHTWSFTHSFTFFDQSISHHMYIQEELFRFCIHVLHSELTWIIVIRCLFNEVKGSGMGGGAVTIRSRQMRREGWKVEVKCRVKGRAEGKGQGRQVGRKRERRSEREQVGLEEVGERP